MWYPGWTATVNGHPVAILPADLAFRAVPLPEPGKHQVVFTYHPVGFDWGLMISLFTSAGLIVAAWRNFHPPPEKKPRHVPHFLSLGVESLRRGYGLTSHALACDDGTARCERGGEVSA